MSVSSRCLFVGVLMVLLAAGGCSSPVSPEPPQVPVLRGGVPTSVELSATPGNGSSAGRATIAVRVLDVLMAPVSGVTVSFETTSGAVAPSQIVTDDSGRGTANLEAPAGSTKVTATTPNGLSASTLVAVQGPPVPPVPTPGPNPTPTPPGPDPAPLTVSIIASPQPPGQPTSFALSTQAITQASWNFGDGATATTAGPATHVYGTATDYLVSVTVTDARGRTASNTKTVTIPSGPGLPAPRYDITLTATPATVGVNGTATLTATVNPQNGAPPPAIFVWDCDVDSSSEPPAVSNGSTAVCTYPVIKTVNSRVTVSSGDSTVTGSAVIPVTVTPPPTPVVTVNCAQPSSPTPPPLTAHCVVSATLNGTPVMSNDIGSVTWDFGDHSAAVTLATNIADHLYSGPGTYTVIVSAVTMVGTTQKGTGSTTIAIK